MSKKTLNVSQYTMGGKTYSRLAIFHDDNTGTRIVGGKFNDFDSDVEFDIELNEKQVEELIKELNN